MNPSIEGHVTYTRASPPHQTRAFKPPPPKTPLKNTTGGSAVALLFTIRIPYRPSRQCDNHSWCLFLRSRSQRTRARLVKPANPRSARHPTPPCASKAYQGLGNDRARFFARSRETHSFVRLTVYQTRRVCPYTETSLDHPSLEKEESRAQGPAFS